MKKLQIIHLESVGSTNDFAMALVESGVSYPTVVMADSQESGKGRLGKSWISEKGKGLYCSLILQPKLERNEIAKTTLVAGLAVAKYLEDIMRREPVELKWPNDIYFQGRKIAGILTESQFIPEKRAVIVIGVGINVNYENKDLRVGLNNPATSIKIINGSQLKPESLVEPLCWSIIEYVKRFETEGFAKLREEWRQRDFLLGKMVEMINVKKKIVKGRALGIDEDGVLLVEDSEHIHQILSGDVRLAK